MADTFVPVDPTAYVVQQNQAAAAKQPPGGSRDFECAQRGLMAVPNEPLVHLPDSGNVVWDFTAFDFLEMDTPESVAPGVWRHGQLDAPSGLFHVTDGLYQVRGYDLANLTVVEGPDALVVIDPLGSYETARAALTLFRSTTGNSKPVRAVVHTQSGVDHFGGVRGLFDGAVPADLKVYAPDGFLADAVLRQVTQGAHNAKLADYAYGTRLDASPRGLVDSDLGRTVSLGGAGFLAPTDTVGGVLSPSTPKDAWPSWTGVAWQDGLYAVEVAGVQLVLQPAGGHASPAEMNVYLPASKAVYLAGAGLLGAPGKARADLLNATTTAFGTTARIGFGAYGWPVWEALTDEGTPAGDVSAWLAARRTAATAVPDAGPVAPLLATPGYLDTPSRTVREVWAKLNGTALGAPQLAATAKAGLLLPGSAGKQVDAAQRAYDDTVPDYAKAVLLLDPVISAAAIPLAVPAATEKQARALQSRALTQLGYLAPHARLRNALLTAAHDVLDPGSAVTRFTQTVGDLAAYANPLA
ncbi:alkyl sulfatase dimerization domain-containing protein [Kitasatospora sp. NPDC097691]|uniref:alkyl sulfatase dimerization domain-containing protein n=1 Tax=Kitasatospora sp. NPDC097691 TaxID=3157231 RepID=UPI0033314A3D